MDFIDGLPRSMENDSILVVVDRLSKSAHFIPLKHPYSAATVAQAYFDFVYKLHGMPQSIRRSLTSHQIEFGQGTKQDEARADKGRSEGEFEPGDYVYLKLQPYRQVSISQRSNQKLARRYYGPYKILSKIGPVAYKLELPARAKIHHTFHVSLLKRFYGSIPEIPSYPQESEVIKEPELILARKTIKKGKISASKVLVKWSNSEAEDATWEFLYDLLQSYPKFDPWGQGSAEEGSNDASQALIICSKGSGAKSSYSNMEGNGCKEAKGSDSSIGYPGAVSQQGIIVWGKESVGACGEAST
ncbi:uncharacterized protein LOC141631174 [Silene latifolia]|uniref:uncharacterized protein LOC141631174 n=1 Tax=Silene latifolia TaxID=37657 RepID=UPI003D772E98